MEIKIHQVNHVKIAEIIAENIVIKTLQDGVNLLGTIYFQEVDNMIIHKQNIIPAFFD